MANEKLIEKLKDIGVKNKDMKRLLRAFDIMEDVSWNIKRQIEEIFACYKLSKYD